MTDRHAAAVTVAVADASGVSDQIQREIERFLHREAHLLGSEGQRQWLSEMVDTAIRYQVTSRQLRYRKDRSDSGAKEVYLYDDDYRALDIRIKQFETGLQWRVDPPEQILYLVTNIEAFPGQTERQYVVYSNCLVFRNRRVYEDDRFAYRREDALQRDQSGVLRLLKRKVDYGQRFVQGKNLLFFL